VLVEGDEVFGEGEGEEGEEGEAMVDAAEAPADGAGVAGRARVGVNDGLPTPSAGSGGL
jgi:hypothetical protein